MPQDSQPNPSMWKREGGHVSLQHTFLSVLLKHPSEGKTDGLVVWLCVLLWRPKRCSLHDF